MANKKEKSFTTVVGISTIIGALATFLTLFLSNSNSTSYENNSGILNHNSGDTINQQGDNPINFQGNININIGESNITKEYKESKLIMSETSFIDFLEKHINGKIIFNYYNDYDGDGTCEMFALIQKDDSNILEENDCQEIWYVNTDGAISIDIDGVFYVSDTNVYLQGDYSFIVFNERGLFHNYKAHIWGVRNGKPFQPNLSGKVQYFEINDYNELLGYVREYNVNDIAAHIYHPYYFYFDGKSFREYGGIQIKEEDILSLKGGAGMLEMVYAGAYTIDTIFYRNNGIVNINMYKELNDPSGKNYSNLTFRCNKNGKIVTDNCSIESGQYEKSYIQGIATYPEKFPF